MGIEIEPINDIEAEKAVIVSLLLDKETVHTFSEKLNADDYYRTEHQHIISAIIKLALEGNPVDLISVNEKLQKENKLDIVGKDYLQILLENNLPSIANFEYYLSIVKDRAKERKYIETLKLSCNKVYLGVDFSDNLNELKKDIERIENERLQDLTATHYTVNDFFSDLENPEPKIQSNILTDIFYYGGALSFIGGRTGHGKTTYLMNEAVKMIIKGSEHNIAFISLEEHRKFITKKLFVSYWNNKTKYENKYIDLHLSHSEYQEYKPEMTYLFDKIFIFDTPSKIEPLEKQILSYHKKHGVDVFFIDYIQWIYFQDNTMNKLTRQEQLKHVNSRLLDIAKKYNLYLILGAQFNREVDEYKDIKSDAKYREAGDIEQDANLLINLWKEKDDNMKFYIAKNRNGKSTGEYEAEIDLEHLIINKAEKIKNQTINRKNEEMRTY